tara:strand:+ start:335 stop:748 length:414 start_codon:yes stop_codon:yes gene_type:complete
MGHWAEIDENNIVKRVIVIKEAELDTGNWGDKSKWIKTSYNTSEGKHYVPSENQDFTVESPDQSKALRYRYAGEGMVYDATNDVFYYPKPFASWILNKEIWAFEAPIPAPKLENDDRYVWDEDLYQSDNTKGWVKEE